MSLSQEFQKTHPVIVEHWHQLLRGARRGNIRCQFQLGQLYESDQLGDPDCEKARWWFRQAAQNCKKYALLNNPEAQYMLAYANYFYDEGGAGMDEGRDWFKKAAAKGYAPAQYMLGQFFYDGNGMDCDCTQAAFWWYKAALQGYADAQCSLAKLFYRGEGGVPKDEKEAMYWYNAAAANGDTEAQYILGAYAQDFYRGE
jgi:TPR repeat protein